MTIPPAPEFRSPSFLRTHIAWVMDFYADRAIDPSGGMYHYFLDDGTVFDKRTRHLVNATRFVITHAMLTQLTGEARFMKGMRHGVDFLRTAFRDPASGGYAWMVDWHDGKATVLDASRHCYGMAFVMLAYAHALKSGVAESARLAGGNLRAGGKNTSGNLPPACTPMRRNPTGRCRRTAARTPTCTPAKR